MTRLDTQSGSLSITQRRSEWNTGIFVSNILSKPSLQFSFQCTLTLDLDLLLDV